MIADLNPNGDSWAQGTRSLRGKAYHHSIAWIDPCSDTTFPEQVSYDLPGHYNRFTATVGIDVDPSDANEYWDPKFLVYIDTNDDKKPQESERVTSTTATGTTTSHIDVALKGATRLILQIDPPDDCLDSPAVWGDPKIS